MNANKQDVGGLFYPSGDDVDQMIELAIQCGIDNRGTSWPVTLCRLRAKVRAELCRAAPAGGDVERFSPDCEPCSDFESWVGCMRPDPNGQWVRYAPAGLGEVEPLPVFSGNWIYVDTGQRFSGADLDGAAFAVYEPLLRKLQQGAE